MDNVVEIVSKYGMTAGYREIYTIHYILDKIIVTTTLIVEIMCDRFGSRSDHPTMVVLYQ